MPLVSEQLPALFNGVSQQPATLRLPSQAEAQVNGYPTVADGLRKRPPFESIANVSADDWSEAFIHTINRDTTERYIVVITDGELEVYDTDGTQKTVSFPEGKTYLDVNGVKAKAILTMDVLPTDGETFTIQGQTWTLKDTLSVAGHIKIGTTITETLENIRQALNQGFDYGGGGAGTQFYIGTNGSNYAVPYLPGDDTLVMIASTWTAATGNAYTVSETMADSAWDDTTFSGGVEPGAASTYFAAVSVADYTFIVNKSVVVEMDYYTTDASTPTGWANYYIPITWAPTTGAAPDIRYYNESGTLQGTKQTFTDLPPAAESPSEGDVWKIAGNGADSFGAYYVRRTGGVWEECVKPGLENRFLDDTMPWALVRESDGTFSFKPFKWNVRKMGDDVTNPPPTFLGKTINDVFFYKNRLAFVSDENVIFSAAGDFGNFWRSTTTDLIDSDVVDVAVSSSQVSLLRFAVPFNNNLMLFADQTQFALNVDQLLTPSSVSIDTVTEFQMNVRARPVGIGNDIYFTTESGNYTRVREYFVQEGSDNSTDAADVTAHVPKYVPSGVFKLAGNSNEDVLFAISDKAGERHRVYVYKFYWNEDGKAQSAWSYWDHGDENSEILSIEVLENELFILIDRADGVYLEKCNVQSGQTTGALDFEVLLDRLVDVTGVYAAGPDTTTFTLPYPVVSGNQADYKLVRGGDFTGEVGSLIDPSTYTWDSTTEITVPGDESAGECHCGQNYTMTFTFSEQFMKSGEKAVTTGRLQLRTMTLYYTDSGFFQTSVDPYGIDDAVTEDVVPSALASYTGKTIGAASLITGEPNFDTGQYTFSVNGNSRDAVISLLNDTHVQSAFQGAEWEALYHNRAGIR